MDFVTDSISLFQQRPLVEGLRPMLPLRSSDAFKVLILSAQGGC